MKTVIKKILPLFFILVLLLLTYLYGLEITAFSGFPKGYDSYGHMGLTRIVRDSFPHIYWNPYWDSGTTLLVRSYPPMTYLLGAFLSRVFSWSLPKTFIFLTTISVSFIIFGVFCFVFLLTRQSLSAFLAALLVISSPAFWAYIIEGGLYPRLFGTVPLIFVWMFAHFYLKAQKGLNVWYFLTVICLFYTFLFHQLSTLFVFVSISLFTLIWIKPKSKALIKLFLLFMPVFLLAAFYYLPLLTIYGNNPPLFGKFANQRFYDPIPLARLFKPERTIAAVPMLLIPLALLSFFLRFGQKIKEKSEQQVLAVLRVMLILAIFCLLYTIGWFGGYFHGVYPHHLLFYFVIFLSIYTGISLGLAQSIKSNNLLLLAICASILISWQKQIPALKQRVVDYSKIHQQVFQSITVDQNEKNFRFGNADEVVAGWFNYQYLLPQTRDYYPFSPLYPNWQYLLEDTVWKDRDNSNETNFFLDWLAINNFYSRTQTGIQQLSQDNFKVGIQTKRIGENEFAYQKAAPILDVINTPVMAIIADDSSYEILIKDLALGNLNSQTVIPVMLGDRLVDLENKNLAYFDAVILYGFTGDITPNIALKLADYVKKGGRLLIERSKSGYDQDQLPDPWPFNAIKTEAVKKHLKLEQADSSFPAIEDYSDETWGIEVGTGLKYWAKPMIVTDNKTVVVAGELGAGTVVWSGLNFPYHLQVAKSDKELGFFSNLILKLLPTLKGEDAETKATFINGQRREIEINKQAKGILFKESYFTNWKAYIEQTVNGKTKNIGLKIYPAGPMMMYIPIQETSFPAKAVLYYQVSFLEKLGLVISLISWAVLLILFGKSIIRKLRLDWRFPPAFTPPLTRRK